MDVNGISLDSTRSPEIAGLVNDSIHHSNADIAKSYSGASEGRGLLNTPDHMNSQLSYGNDAQSAAIKQRTDQAYGRSEKALSLKNIMNADSDHVRNLQIASQAANQEVQTNMQKDLLRDKISQANKRARGQVVGNVLGIVGAVVGGVVGGYATGGAGVAPAAAAGYQGGQALGQGIGG